jgi:hypothetical protein
MTTKTLNRPSDNWLFNTRRVIQDCRKETGMPFYILMELLSRKHDIVDDYSLAAAVGNEWNYNLIEDIKRASTTETAMPPTRL